MSSDLNNDVFESLSKDFSFSHDDIGASRSASRDPSQQWLNRFRNTDQGLGGSDKRLSELEGKVGSLFNSNLSLLDRFEKHASKNQTVIQNMAKAVQSKLANIVVQFSKVHADNKKIKQALKNKDAALDKVKFQMGLLEENLIKSRERSCRVLQNQINILEKKVEEQKEQNVSYQRTINDLYQIISRRS